MMVQEQSQTSMMDPLNEASALATSQAVQEVARAKLQRSAYQEIRKLTCDFHEGVLTLRGRVSSYYLKQVAQTLVFRLDGVGELNNRLEVGSPPPPGGSAEDLGCGRSPRRVLGRGRAVRRPPPSAQRS
jgi:osmotically-inducible protein OsmY